MNLIEHFCSLLRNSKPVQRGILLTRRTITVGSACLLSLGIGGGVAYKEWQTQSQRQGQVQINNCFFVPTPSATPIPKPAHTAKPTPKTVTLPESA
ncbi:MAG: hypothetical protein RM049_27680 [Nostoc sp. DedQUE04]|uniref:hypothetical protein n=1 Tax=Nostoc sp. DedQUE04 TaxID=3075390 RepID=UPI002AD2E876|nr:hypothetical protein [Nostoc sp. DedQUE04]MDZ8139016.1 hypothetical protein [Nostoc sp. DedQUE04]